MEDVDMFGSTQAQAGEDADEMYTSIATEIAVRKCRLDQKKEKLKLLFHSLKKVNDEIRLAKEERERIIQEKKEVAHCQAIAVTNLERTQESRKSRETTLCELNNKLTFEKAETKRQSDEYKAALQKASETWECYEKMYKDFPLAKELQELQVEWKKVNFEKRLTIMLVDDLRRQKKLKDEITDKLNHAKLVKLAKLYVEYQNKIAEKDSLLLQKRNLEKHIEDTNTEMSAQNMDVSENITKDTPSQVIKHTQRPQRTMTFNMPEIQIKSPPPVDNSATPSRGTLFNWRALLGSSNSLFNFTKRNSQPQEKSTAFGSAQNISSPNVSSVPAKPQPTSSNNQVEAMTPITGTKTKDDMALKRIAPVSLNEKVGQETMLSLPLKKLNNQNVSLIKSIPEMSSQQKQVIKKTNFTGNTKKKGFNKENITTNNSSSSLNKYMTNLNMRTNKSSTSSFSQKENVVYHNLSNMLTLKTSDNNIELSKKTSQESIPPAVQTISDDSDFEKNDQINLMEATDNGNFDGDLFANENQDKQPENTIVSMDPNSPPDLVPVENNSQPLSQGMINSAKFPSQHSSDFNSPIELNERERQIFQKYAAESPEFTYPKGTDMVNSQKLGVEALKPVVRSQYFSDMQPFSPSSSLNTPPINQDVYHSMPYSPSGSGFVSSPPNAGLGGFDTANSGPIEMSLFGKTSKQDDGNQNNGFNLCFDGASKNKTSCIFSLFN